MAGEKAKAATDGIREMLVSCQSQGPRGLDRSYYRMVLIKFGCTATIDPKCSMTPVRHIDPDTIEIRGDGGGTDIANALDLACGGLERYMREYLLPHPERSEHPLPLVLLFSDGCNGGSDPIRVAKRIKSLSVDGIPVTIAVAGVAVGGTHLDEALLRKIASPECYVSIDDLRVLKCFLAEVGSSCASSPQEAAEAIARLRAADIGGQDAARSEDIDLWPRMLGYMPSASDPRQLPPPSGDER
jgi:hypothetical protein